MSRRNVLGLHGLIFIALVLLALFTPGTGGGGDSLAHYFICEYGWTDPRALFRHWGKPFFAIIASPFAQFGFTGIEIFNALCGTLASYFTYLVALKLNKPGSWLIPFIAFSSPVFYVYLMSGLTEPFSALVCISTVLLILNNKTGWAFVLASFLPFCRSEAQLFLALYVGYALLNKQWKYIPLLAVGYVCFAVIGRLLYFDSLFWVFDIPYKAGKSPYGSGPWWHYIDRLRYMLAIPALSVLFLGIAFGLKNLFTQANFWRKEALLIHAFFLSLIISHSVVWALGIYASAGLERVLVLVFPYAWLIILDGLNFVNGFVKKYSYFPFWIVPAIFMIVQINYIGKDPVARFYRNIVTKLKPEDKTLRDVVAPYIKEKYPEISLFVLEKPYLALQLDINPMNGWNRGDWDLVNADTIRLPQKEALFIWDNRYPEKQYQASLEKAENHHQLKRVKEFESPNGWQFVLFEFKAVDSDKP